MELSQVKTWKNRQPISTFDLVFQNVNKKKTLSDFEHTCKPHLIQNLSTLYFGIKCALCIKTFQNDFPH
jgi:hypothetical protein